MSEHLAQPAAWGVGALATSTQDLGRLLMDASGLAPSGETRLLAPNTPNTPPGMSGGGGDGWGGLFGGGPSPAGAAACSIAARDRHQRQPSAEEFLKMAHGYEPPRRGNER